jgi:uncharacterized protein (TIGR02145 family)
MKKKSRILIYSLIVIGFVLIFSNACKKDEEKEDPAPTPAPAPTPGPNVTDIDGNVYHSVIIGTQTWMVENLKTTRYRDGTVIPNITDNTQWLNLTTGAYCDYSNNTSNTSIYGRLYNWYAVNNNLAPTGWHVPTSAEWTVIANYLGGWSSAGGKLKENGTTHWNSPNTDATNETGFRALPGGIRNIDPPGGTATFNGIGSSGCWWSANDYNGNPAYYTVNYSSIELFHSNNGWGKRYGYSVRCVKD